MSSSRGTVTTSGSPIPAQYTDSVSGSLPQLYTGVACLLHSMEETRGSTSKPNRLKQICTRARETCSTNFMRGVIDDIRGRLPWYKDDYREGMVCGLR